MTTTGATEPLRRFAALRTRDLAEAEEFIAGVYVPHRMTADGALDTRLNVVRSGDITLGWLRYGAETRLVAPPMTESFHLNLALAGTTLVHQGGVAASTAAYRSGVMISPDQTSRLRWSADAAQFAMKIHRHTLETQLSALLHDAVSGPLHFALAVDLQTPEGAALLAGTQFIAAQLELQSELDDLIRQQVESFLLTQVLLGVPNNYRHRLTANAGPIPRVALDEAVDYIEAHPERRLGIAELATVAGVPAAELRGAFRAQLDSTPEEYVRGVRLARAHAELADGWTGTPEALARRWGFSDAERFAAAYAARYGRPPAFQI